MSATTVVRFDTAPHGGVYLSELSDGPPYTVHGIALGAGDVTVGQSGIKKKWPASELEEAADTLKGTNLVTDHDNTATGVVGRVTKSGFKQGTGVVYEAELFDEDLAEKVKNGLLEVSIRGYHADVDSLEEDGDAKLVEDIEFDNLSIVPTGAAPSNTLNMGEHAELSAAELAQFTAELEDIEAGDWVETDAVKGIAVSMPEDGKVDVDIYEKIDGTWRSVEEVNTYSLNTLERWDVDEDSVGGAAEKDSEENRHSLIIPSMQFYSPVNDSLLTVQTVEGKRALMSADGEDGDSNWYEPIREIYRGMADGKLDYHDPSGDMPLVMSGMKFYSTTNNSVQQVVRVMGDTATMRTMDSDSSWKKPVDEIINDLADGDLRVFHPEDEIAEMAAVSEFVFEDKADAMQIVEDDDSGILTDVHSHEANGQKTYMPGADMDEFTRWHENKHSEEAEADAKYSQGDWVEWDTRNSTEIGKVTGGYVEGEDLPDFRGDRNMSPEDDEVLYGLRMYKQRDGTWHPISGKAIGHYEKSLRSTDEPSDVSDSYVELGRSNTGSYDVEKDDWVQWYPSETTEEHGFVLDVEDDIVTIEVWTQNGDGDWETDGEEITKDMEDVEPWGNFPRKQEEFADAISGEDPRRAVKPSEENSAVESLISEQVEKALKEKRDEHNEEHAEDDESKRVTYRMLKNVFNRGMGAYQDSHREGMTPQQWSYARVNAFLYLVRNGNPENDNYTQDNDLLPEEHPKYNETSEEENAAVDAPDFESGDMVYWQVHPAMMGKVVHVDRDRQIVMVEIMEEEDGEMKSSGFTVSAGYSDLMHEEDMTEEMAVTTGDMPTQDAPPMHDGSTKSMLARFMEATDIEDPTMADFTEWLADTYEDLALGRNENQEAVINSNVRLKIVRDEQPHRFVDAEDESSAELADTYDDYPQEAVDNAQMALDAKEDTGNPRGCGTRTGWIRAQQLADEEPISRDVIARMSAFNRHRQNSEMDDEEGRTDCGWMMWNAWGGDAGVDWAQKKLDSIAEEAAMADVPEEHMFNDPDEAAEKAEDLGMEGSHEMDGMWIPGESHEDYMDNVATSSYYEDASASEGKTVKRLSDVEALIEYDMHAPSYEGTTEESWSAPDLEDIMAAYGFDEEHDSYESLPQDAKETIGDHFVISMSGFPAENFGDYKLPVVTTDGELSLNALLAVKGGRGVSAVEGLNEDMEDEITEMMNELANDEFDKDYGMEEMMEDIPMEMRYESEEDAMQAAKDMGITGAHAMTFDGEEMYVPGDTHDMFMDAVSSMGGYSSMGGHMDSEEDDEEMGATHSITGTSGGPTAQSQKRPGGMRVLTGDDLWQGRKSRESDADSLNTNSITNMKSEIEEMLSDLDEPVAVEASEVEQLREKANRFEEMSDSLEALRERTDVLDSVDQSLVEELAEADDAIVVESARYEELESEAAQVKGIYADELAEQYPAFSADELTDKFSIDELREKYEDEVGEIESLAASTEAEPRSQDADEESLEEAAEPDTDEEELSDEIAQKQAEIRENILGGN